MLNNQIHLNVVCKHRAFKKKQMFFPKQQKPKEICEVFNDIQVYSQLKLVCDEVAKC